MITFTRDGIEWGYVSQEELHDLVSCRVAPHRIWFFEIFTMIDGRYDLCSCGCHMSA
jgi:hypothetical protein